ncbi:hypothetical protein [Levilactobacillus brevis]|uniref:hypothetical protein n=1 Tax=Levilactobacillus brevis TaxID=1580 RepID=UPI0021A2C5BF|nr:hypothetical protein [Levilactobacillus brevis]MCT3569367.1 hypothetical protein [Levilactobacillus brevis]MCT3577954.1 hypothetical protein [Levilactobacillus brevis]MCT3580554.1 hypothetical protein [Levilactobacillus brevis]
MPLSAMEKKQAQLDKLNEQIKNEKARIEKTLGHEIIKLSGIEYASLDKASIKEIAKKAAIAINQNEDSSNKINQNQNNF